MQFHPITAFQLKSSVIGGGGGGVKTVGTRGVAGDRVMMVRNIHSFGHYHDVHRQTGRTVVFAPTAQSADQRYYNGGENEEKNNKKQGYKPLFSYTLNVYYALL